MLHFGALCQPATGPILMAQCSLQLRNHTVNIKICFQRITISKTNTISFVFPTNHYSTKVEFIQGLLLLAGKSALATSASLTPNDAHSVSLT